MFMTTWMVMGYLSHRTGAEDVEESMFNNEAHVRAYPCLYSYLTVSSYTLKLLLPLVVFLDFHSLDATHVSQYTAY